MPHAEQLSGVVVECLDAALLIQYHQPLVEHFKDGLLFLEQGLQRHLPGDGFGRGLDGAQRMEMKPARLRRQGQHPQRPALGIADRRGGAMHAALAQAKPEVLLGQHIHQTVFDDRQPSAIGALYRLQQATAYGGEVQAAEVQRRACGIGQVDMAPGVISEQTAHDLRRRGDQQPVGGQCRGQVVRCDKTVLAVFRIEAGIDAAQPGFPNHPSDPGRTIGLPTQARSPSLIQRNAGSFVQRRRAQGGEVIAVFGAQRRKLLVHYSATCSYFRHVSIDMSLKRTSNQIKTTKYQ